MQTARYRWDGGKYKQRLAMLAEIGQSHHKTYTLRAFRDLPIELIVDLNYAETLRTSGAACPMDSERAASDGAPEYQVLPSGPTPLAPRHSGPVFSSVVS